MQPSVALPKGYIMYLGIYIYISQEVEQVEKYKKVPAPLHHQERKKKGVHARHRFFFSTAINCYIQESYDSCWIFFPPPFFSQLPVRFMLSLETMKKEGRI